MKRLVMLIIMCSVLASVNQGQTQTRYLNNQRYDLIDGQWYQVEGAQEYRVNGSIISVKFKNGVDSLGISAFTETKAFEIDRVTRTGFHKFIIPEGHVSLDVVESLLTHELVDIVEVTTFGIPFGDPDDTRFSDQWYHKNANDRDIDSPEAWDLETGDEDIVIAIIDGGLEYDHEDVTGNVWVNPGEDYDGDGVVGDFGLPCPPANCGDEDGEDNDGNGYVDDLMGWNFDDDNNYLLSSDIHGTWVSGIAGAVTDNTKGIAGVAGGWHPTKGVKLMICNVGANYDVNAVDEAIQYVSDKNVEVANMSFGVGENLGTKALIKGAYFENVFFVAASGKTGTEDVKFPANYEYVFGVGASKSDDKRYSLSNYGNGLELVAPGNSILTTTNNDDYTYKNGTSMAAPMVAGVAALLISYSSSYSNTDVWKIIARSAEKVVGYGYDQNKTYGKWNNEMGYGRLNAFYAVAPPATPTGSTSRVMLVRIQLPIGTRIQNRHQAVQHIP